MNPNLLKRMKYSVAALLAFLLLISNVPAVLGASAVQTDEVRELLEEYHLSHPADEELADKEIEEMVDALQDPYTEYFDEEEWARFNSDLEQKFVGVGIVMIDNGGKAYVDEVLADSPAASAGVQAGDLLVSADGLSFKGKPLEEIQKAIRGEEGTSVALTVSRSGKTLKFKIDRKEIQVPIVKTALLDKGVGYLALSSFTSEAGKEFKDQLEKLENKGLTSLILDLRNNGGGYVSAAQDIAGLFVEKGVLAHMRNREGVDEPLPIRGSTKPYPVVILVNGNTASASELLSGALRDYGVAKLVGTKTYGKGVVQSIIPVKSGGMLKVTVQEYYTPTGKKVDQVGLAPNLTVNGTAQQLIAAYRLAGGRQVTVSSGNDAITVNGVRLGQPGAMYREKNVWYVDIKLAASVIGAKLTYDAKSHSYKLSNGSEAITIKTSDSRLKIKDGKSSIDVRLLKKTFSGFTYTASGSALKLVSG